MTSISNSSTTNTAHKRLKFEHHPTSSTATTTTTTTTAIVSMLDVLDEDAMRAWLVRTQVSDHTNLRAACTRFQNIIDSDAFCRERIELGYVEAHAQLVTPFERYCRDFEDDDDDEDEENWNGMEQKPREKKKPKKKKTVYDKKFLEMYGEFGFNPEGTYEKCQARLKIDGRTAGKAEFTLIPRNPRLQSTADALSADLVTVACYFFNRKGNPRLTSFQDAIREYRDQKNKKPMLYLDKFVVYDAKHRQTPELRAKLIRSLLNDTIIKNQFSVAIYIPESKPHFTPEDKNRRFQEDSLQLENMHAKMMGVVEEESPEERSSRTAWEKRLQMLRKHDMRPFLQAGFIQAKELLVEDNECFYVFAIPKMLRKPMLSNAEISSLEILESPYQDDTEPRGDARKLLEILKDACGRRNEKVEHIASLRQIMEAPLTHIRGLQESVNQLVRERQAEVAEYTAQLEERLNEFKQVIENDRQNLERIKSGLVESRTQEQIAAQHEELSTKCRQLEAREEGISQLEESIEQARAHVSQQFIEEVAIRCIQDQKQREIEAAERDLGEFDARIRDKVADLIQSSSEKIILESYAMHVCAANSVPEYACMLLSFVPEGEKQSYLNHTDNRGNTVLMVAAGSGLHGLTERLETCRALIELGADKNIVHAYNGRTALGMFWERLRESRYAANSMNLPSGYASRSQEQVQMEENIEKLLYPLDGETAEDAACFDSEDEIESESEDEDEVHDEHEEDYV